MALALVYLPHVLAGTAVLLFFWRTFLSRKGSGTHRRNGRIYFLLLLPLLVSIVPIVVKEATTNGPVRIVQLVYLSLVVSAAGWTAWRAIKDKHDVRAFRGKIYVALAVALAGSASLLMVMGIATQNLMAFGFSAIGIVYGGAMLGFLRRDPAPDWWRQWHLNGIALLFAATHASFTGLVVRSLRPDWDGDILHGLTQFGVIAMAYFFRQMLAWRYESSPRLAVAPA